MLNRSSDSALTARILDSVPVGVLSVDTDLRIKFANHASEYLLGRSSALLEGKRIEEVLTKGSELEALLEKANVHGGSVSARKLKIEGPSHDVIEVDAHAAPNHDLQLLVVSLTPVRGPSEQDLKQESAAMAEVARILGHEVKNPLAGLLGAAQLLARKAREDQQSLLTVIQEEGKRIERILDRFVAFETFFHPRLCKTNIHRVLSEVMELCRASYAQNIELRAQFDPSLPEIDIDPDHFHEAILNIVKNASEAINESEIGDRITIETRFKPGVRLEQSRSNNRRGGAYEVTIYDNGPGIPLDVRKKIFSPFFTTRENGDGVGLAVAAEIVQAHGGYIEVDNNKDGRGACFRLLLPIDNVVI